MLEFLTLFFTSVMPKNYDHWHSQMLWGESCIIFWISWHIYKKLGPIPAIAMSYFGVYGVISEFRKTDFFYIQQGDLQPQFDTAVARSLIYMMLCLLPFIFSKRESTKRWLDAFIFLSVVDSIVMIYKFFLVWNITGHHATGLIGMDSMDGSFLAIMLPLIIFERIGLLLIPIVVAIVLSKSSTVYAIICFEALSFTLICAATNKRRRLLALSTSILVGVLTYPVGKWYLGSELLNSNGRANVIGIAKNLFINVHKFWFGLGTGSYISTVPFLEGRKLSGFFVFLHSEPLQVLFEFGIVGLAILMALYFCMLFRSKNNFPLFVSLCGSGVMVCFQPCFRYFLFSLFMAFLCRYGLEGDSIDQDCHLSSSRL